MYVCIFPTKAVYCVNAYPRMSAIDPRTQTNDWKLEIVSTKLQKCIIAIRKRIGFDSCYSGDGAAIQLGKGVSDVRKKKKK